MPVFEAAMDKMTAAGVNLINISMSDVFSSAGAKYSLFNFEPGREFSRYLYTHNYTESVKTVFDQVGNPPLPPLCLAPRHYLTALQMTVFATLNALHGHVCSTCRIGKNLTALSVGHWCLLHACRSQLRLVRHDLPSDMLLIRWPQSQQKLCAFLHASQSCRSAMPIREWALIFITSVYTGQLPQCFTTCGSSPQLWH